MLVRESSARCLASYTYSLRRSWVSCGKARRMTWPSFAGLMPRSELRIAFSIEEVALRSYGETTSSRASGAEMPASCWSGVGVP
jgi:hypothetical protein